MIANNLASIPMGEGMDRTLISVVEHLSPKPGGTEELTANILRLSILDKDRRTTRDKLESLLAASASGWWRPPGSDCSRKSPRVHDGKPQRGRMP